MFRFGRLTLLLATVGAWVIAQSGAASADLLFGPEFDTYPDWAPTYAGQDYVSRADLAKDAQNVPPGFDFYYTSERWHPNGNEVGADAHPDRQPAGQISDMHGSFDSGDGKAFVIYDESYGSPTQWGADAILLKQFPREYPELFIEFYVKFDPDWVWMNEMRGSGESAMKLFRVLRFFGTPNDSRFHYLGDHLKVGPAYILDLKSSWAPVGTRFNPRKASTARVDNAIRPHPYSKSYLNQTEFIINSDRTFAEAFLDDQWHRIGVHLTMNSAAGVPDGTVRVYYDGVLQSALTDVEWNTVHGEQVTGWNEVAFGGNVHNYPFPQKDRYEQWYAISGIRVWDEAPAEYAP